MTCALVAGLGSSAIAQSFDCRRASAPDEKAICADGRLSQLDTSVAAAFASVKHDAFAVERAAKSLKDRRDCGGNRLCILDNQVAELLALADSGARAAPPSWVATYRLSLIEQGVAPMVSGLPQRVGSCTRSKITLIGSRFGERLTPEDNGTIVNFANGLHQVSYAYEAPVAKSVIGDLVVLCLASLPRNCPKGDDRGRFYSATNLRTLGTWLLPDAQHVCGGA